jgi:DNA-binding MarR family transcriptional regulator
MSQVKVNRPAPEDALPQALGRLRVALEDGYARASRELGLTPQQAELLCAAMSPVPIGALAETLRCDRSNVSRLVDRGSLRGLLRRRGGEEDARVTLVELTPEGERLARRFLAALKSQSEAVRSGWPRARKQLATEVLNEISDALGASNRPSPNRRRRSPSRDASGVGGRRGQPKLLG